MSKDQKYLAWADAGAQIFSTCSKGQYMAILVDKDGYIVGTGYNGTPKGWTHCIDGGCPRALTSQVGGAYADCLSVHAEMNAFTHSDATRVRGGTLYVNGLPCWDCAKVIVNSGLRRLVYLTGSRAPIDLDEILVFLEEAEIEVVGL